MIDTVQLAGFRDAETELRHLSLAALPGPSSLVQAKKSYTWIEDVLSKSNADFVLVAGHYPIYSACAHGNTEELVKNLDPLLKKYDVTAYLSGHEHCQFHYVYEGMNYILTGTGGECCYGARNTKFLPKGGEMKYILAGPESGPESTKWSFDVGADGGFASFEVSKERMRVKLHKEDGGVLYESVLLPRTYRLRRSGFKQVSAK